MPRGEHWPVVRYPESQETETLIRGGNCEAPVGAEEALLIGLATQVVPAAQVIGAALELAAGLTAGPTVGHGLAKRAIDEGLELTLREGLDLAVELFVEVLGAEDARAGVTSYLEHGPGKPRFTRRLNGHPWDGRRSIDALNGASQWCDCGLFKP